MFCKLNFNHTLICIPSFLLMFIFLFSSSPSMADQPEVLARLTPQKIEQYEKERQDAINGFIKQGKNLFNENKFVDAKVQFEKVLKLDTGHAEALDLIKKCDIEIQNQKKGLPRSITLVEEETKQPETKDKETVKASDDEAKRLAAEKRDAERKAREEQLAAERKAREEQKELEKAEKEAAAKAEKEQKEAERKAREEAAKKELEAKRQAEADRKAQEIAAREASQKAEEERKIAEKAAADAARKARIEKEAEQKRIAEEEKRMRDEELAAKRKAEQDRRAEEKAAAEASKKAEQERIVAEKRAAEEAKLKQQQELEAQKKATAEKAVMEKAEKEAAIKAEEARIKAQREEEQMKARQAEEEKKAQDLRMAQMKSEEEKKAAEMKRMQEEEARKAEQERKAAELSDADKKRLEEKAMKEKEAEEKAKAKETERLAREEAKLKKEQIVDHLSKGKKLYRSNKIEEITESITEFEQVLALDAGNSEALRYRTLAQNKLEEKQSEIARNEEAKRLAEEQKAMEEARKAEEAQKIAEEQKPVEEKPVEEMPVEEKPVEEKPIEEKPVEEKPMEEPVVTEPAPVVVEEPVTQPTEDINRQEALRRAEEEESRVRAEREREETARRTREAEDHYKAGITYLNQGQILKAHEEWNVSLALVPEHQGAKTMIEETRAEYEQALEIQRKEQEVTRLEAENIQRLEEPIITIDVADQEIGDILTQMGAVAGFNIVIGEGVKAKVSASFTNVSLKKALDSLLPLHGFKYSRQGDIIQISLDLKTKIYPLTNEQVQKLRFAMIEDQILQRTLYGPDGKPKVPGQELILDERGHLLSITDSSVNIDKVDEFLQNLPPIRAEELITKTFTIREGNAEEIRKLVQAVLTASPVKGIDDEQRKVILEPGSNTLVILDSVDNIKKVEDFLIDKNFLDRLTNQELSVKVYHLSPEENVMTPEALARKAELVNNVGEVLETMLYAAEGREKAYELGRRIFKDPRSGTITVVDTGDNLRKIEAYVSQLPTGEEQKLLSKVFTIKNADPNNIRNLINQILQESRGGTGGAGAVGSYVTGVIVPGAGNGLTFLDATVELIEVTGDTANPQARLYIYTPARDREVTLSRGNSDLVDEYRVRLVTADVDRQEAEIEIRLASFAAVQRSQGIFNQQQGFNQFGTQGQLQQPFGTQQTLDTQQQAYRRPTLRVDRSTNNLIVLAFDPTDMTMIEEWISKLDVPILQVSIEAKFIEVSETKAKKLGIDWLVPSLSDWGSFDLVQDQLTFGRSQGSLQEPVKATSGVDPLIEDLRNNSLLSGGTLLQIQTVGGLSMTLETLEAEGVVNVINAPRITALNQEQASLTIVQTIPWLQLEGSATEGITFDWVIDSVLIDLQVTPTIHADGSIILDIQPQVDRVIQRLPSGFNQVPPSIWTAVGLASPTLGILESDITGQPIIDRRTLQTVARVQDGGTIVLGGLIQEQEHTAESKVPLLGDIPFLKYLFKKNIDYKEKTRLFIFLTATVVP